MTVHRCPAKGCGLSVAFHMLMCRTHWYMVPRPLRNAVWATWDNGAGSGSPQHASAIDAAITAVNKKLEAAS